jgi:hypothetical protein
MSRKARTSAATTRLTRRMSASGGAWPRSAFGPRRRCRMESVGRLGERARSRGERASGALLLEALGYRACQRRRHCSRGPRCRRDEGPPHPRDAAKWRGRLLAERPGASGIGDRHLHVPALGERDIRWEGGPEVAAPPLAGIGDALTGCRAPPASRTRAQVPSNARQAPARRQARCCLREGCEMQPIPMVNRGGAAFRTPACDGRPALPGPPGLSSRSGRAGCRSSPGTRGGWRGRRGRRQACGWSPW